MRQIILLVLVLSLSSCVVQERIEQDKSEYEVKYTNDYVNDLNWYMLYMFSVTKSVNEYAMQHGWTPPKAPPICRMVEWPNLPPLPQFKPSYDRKNPRSFEIELGNYVMAVKRAYHEGAVGLKESEKSQRKLCLY